MRRGKIIKPMYIIKGVIKIEPSATLSIVGLNPYLSIIRLVLIVSFISIYCFGVN